jgi:hypothetical protein
MYDEAFRLAKELQIHAENHLADLQVILFL